MIVNFQELRKQNKEKEFDLGEAIRNDEVDIIFCGNNDFEDVLNEIAVIKKKKSDNIRLLVRDSTDINEHVPTIKVQYNKCPIYEGRQGIPILFDIKNKDWYVYLGKSDKKKAKAENYEEILKKEKSVYKFLNAVAEEIGPEISEYTKCKKEDSEKKDKIISSIKNKYYVEDKD